jgi:hypothetical protein
MHKSGQDLTDAGIWSFFTMLGKDNIQMIIIMCYIVCSRTSEHILGNLLGTTYQHQCRIIEQDEESQDPPIEPHIQTPHNLQ